MSNCNNIPVSGTVHARLRMSTLNRGEIFIDKDRDNNLDMTPRQKSEDKKVETSQNTEPVFVLTMRELKDFAKMNCHKGVLTQEDIGDLKTLGCEKKLVRPRHFFDSLKTNWAFEPDGKTLNEIAPSLSALTEGKENVQWAIDPMVHEPYTAELFLYTPDKPESVAPTS
jgi:hypothetical protein